LSKIDCPNCDQKFHVECSVSIKYTTKKIED
jgi:hypothetical protein